VNVTRLVSSATHLVLIFWVFMKDKQYATNSMCALYYLN